MVNNHQILLIGFDLDGTLVHTNPQYANLIINATLKEFGKSATPEQVSRFWFQKGRCQYIQDAFGIEPEQFWKVYTKYDTPESKRRYISAYTDAKLLLELKNRGYKLGLLTGAPPDIMDLELKLLPDVFDITLVANPRYTDIRLKPDAHGLELMMQTFGCLPHQTIYVGNGNEDVEAAQAAGVLDIFINRQEHNYNGINPTITIDTLSTLKQFI